MTENPIYRMSNKKKIVSLFPNSEPYIFILYMKRNLHTRSFRGHNTAWLILDSYLFGMQVKLRLDELKRKACGIQ